MALPPDTAAALDRLTQFGVRLGLERMRCLLAALGDPQADLPVVLVAGTNGKGTVSALLASFASAARYRTGLYTSPHLETVEERLRLDGAPIGGERLGGLLERVLGAAGEALEEPPTYFEALTACALVWFAEEKVDLAVLEVGLGGRFDATNATEPRLSVITSIDLDHREYLGSTRAEVAREKAGVMRADRPVVVADGPPEVTEVLAEEARRAGARLVPATETLRVDAVQRFKPFADPLERRQRIWVRDEAGERRVYEIALAGRHQAENLALALVAAETLSEEGWERLTSRALTRGCRGCRWPGRLEEVSLPDGGRVLLDVAHNPAGAAALAVALDDLGEPVDLVFGVLAEKEAEPMLAALAPRARRITLTRPSGPRGREAASLVPLVPRVPEPGSSGPPGRAGRERSRDVEVVEAPGDALVAALRRAAGRIVVACGSLAMVGELRAFLHRRYGVPQPAVEMTVGGVETDSEAP